MSVTVIALVRTELAGCEEPLALKAGAVDPWRLLVPVVLAFPVLTELARLVARLAGFALAIFFAQDSTEYFIFLEGGSLRDQ